MISPSPSCASIQAGASLILQTRYLLFQVPTSPARVGVKKAEGHTGGGTGTGTGTGTGPAAEVGSGKRGELHQEWRIDSLMQRGDTKLVRAREEDEVNRVRWSHLIGCAHPID